MGNFGSRKSLYAYVLTLFRTAIC